MPGMRKAKAKRPIVQQPNFEQVGYLCRRVMQASLRDLQQAVPDLDVTIGQMGTLVLIACNPGITPTEICRAQGHEKPTITASLDALERKRLISRKPSRLDRRSFSLYLTAKGAAFYNEITPRVKESDKRLTKMLNSDERAQLLDLLMRVYLSECIDEEAITGAPTVRLRAVEGGRADTRSGAKNAKSPRGASRVRDSVHVHVLRQLDELEKSSARLRKVVAGLAG